MTDELKLTTAQRREAAELYGYEILFESANDMDIGAVDNVPLEDVALNAVAWVLEGGAP